MAAAPITTLYAALLALWVGALLLRVVQLRLRLRVGAGDGGHKELTKAIRVHANAIETLPFALLLMFGYELGGGNATVLQACGILLILGRVSHAYGLNKTLGGSIQRVAGTATVLTVIGILATLIILRSS